MIFLFFFLSILNVVRPKTKIFKPLNTANSNLQMNSVSHAERAPTLKMCEITNERNENKNELNCIILVLPTLSLEFCFDIISRVPRVFL